MGLLEPITHKEEIENLLNEAQSKYDAARTRLEAQKEKTANRRLCDIIVSPNISDKGEPL